MCFLSGWFFFISLVATHLQSYFRNFISNVLRSPFVVIIIVQVFWLCCSACALTRLVFFAQKFKCFAPCYLWLPPVQIICVCFLSANFITHKCVHTSRHKKQNARGGKKPTLQTKPQKNWTVNSSEELCSFSQERSLILPVGSTGCASSPSSLQSCCLALGQVRLKQQSGMEKKWECSGRAQKSGVQPGF